MADDADPRGTAPPPLEPEANAAVSAEESEGSGSSEAPREQPVKGAELPSAGAQRDVPLLEGEEPPAEPPPPPFAPLLEGEEPSAEPPPPPFAPLLEGEEPPAEPPPPPFAPLLEGEEPPAEPAPPPLAPRPRAAHRSSKPEWWQTRRTQWIALASFGLCLLIGIDVLFMRRAAEGGPDGVAPPPSASVSAPSGSASPGPPPPAAELDDGTEAPPSAEAKGAGEADDTGLPAFDEDDVDAEPSTKKKKQPPHFGSVQEAAARSCSTASVDGLSRQIIEQGRCINPKAFVPLPSRPNLVLSEHVFPYLEAAARDRLVKALDTRRGSTMTINSALRTVAQQYLVWRWSASKRCGVQLATPPGESNHETGLALDIAEQADWRQTLEAHDFHWLGAIDRVHFDYKGATGSSSTQRATDVLAFQQLWNKNNPSDPIAETGRYNEETERRLKKAPADGFAIGLACKSRGAKPSALANSGKRSH